MSERGGLKPMYVVWIWLLIITIVEVLMAYFHVPVTIMLISLLGMSFVKASMIVAWFMHLKFERVSLVLTLIPAAVMCMILMNVVWPDSVRLHHLGH